jgi:Mechanosensitive ion channel
LRRLILPVTYFLERPFTNWTRTSAESMTSFALVLALNSPLHVIREKLDEVLLNNPLWNGNTKEVMINELGESSMVVRITLSATDPHTALRLKSQVQEELLRFLNQLKGSVLLGAVPEPAAPETTVNSNSVPPKSEQASGEPVAAGRVVERPA